MLKKRIIPTLLLKNNRVVKGKQFKNFRDTGDPVSAARIYNAQYVDELIFLDIDATKESRETNISILSQVTKVCFMPLTVGGGISCIETVRELIKGGADKVMINTAAINNPSLITKVAYEFGSQCIVVGVDVKLENGKYIIYKASGSIKTDLDLKVHLKSMEAHGAGEIFINSIDRDGMMNGYDIDLINLVTSTVDVPVIASGGAGNFMDLVEGYKQTDANALAMASIYHFGDNNPIRARFHLKNNGIAIKNV